MNIINGRGGMPMVRIETPWSAAEIYLQGANVTHFQKHGEPPLLFLSEASRFEKAAPIRGGIPIVFPWFGKPAGREQLHGFARLHAWELVTTQKQPDGSVTLHLRLPASVGLPGVPLEYFVTVGQTLTVELVTTNYSDADLIFENCLHTYFAVGDITAVSVSGLQGVEYLDALDGRARKPELGAAIPFAGEVDRVYINTLHPVAIRDAEWQRTILVEKSGSATTVVWNPWIAKAHAMPDLGDQEYQRMVCVESGNAAVNAISLAPGAETRLRVTLSSTPGA